ncbi:MAG: 2-hydroxyglutaryl-CoA dehydratase, partial [Peptococcaceae bacterium]|nr:2-hydroxyglutaryl-CoA dehydratase [Peptococcaceae bacterium]
MLRNAMERDENGGRKEDGRLVVNFAALGLPAVYEAMTATGYGRQTVNVKGARVIPEVKAHVLGAIYLTGL